MEYGEPYWVYQTEEEYWQGYEEACKRKFYLVWGFILVTRQELLKMIEEL